MWKYLKIGRERIGRVMLVMLLLGAYVPAGYMPADGSPFRVQLCPAASPMPAGMVMPAHHHAGGKTAEHPTACPFGSAPAAGPWVPALVFFLPPPAVTAPSPVLDRERLGTRSARAHQARAPPSSSV